MPRIAVDAAKIAEFCRRHHITRLELFGSVLRDDFGPDSDVDVLVTFSASARWTLLDHIRIERELATLFGRDVDLVTRRSVEQSENWIRRQEILSHAELIHEQG